MLGLYIRGMGVDETRIQRVFNCALRENTSLNSQVIYTIMTKQKIFLSSTEVYSVC